MLFGVAAVVFTFQQIKLGDQAGHVRQLAEANQRLGIQIQIERARSVRDTCEGQNDRHDNTIMVLDQQLAQIYLQEKGKDEDPDKVAALIKRAKGAKTNQDARQAVLDAEKLLGKEVAAEMEAGRAPERLPHRRARAGARLRQGGPRRGAPHGLSATPAAARSARRPGCGRC